MNDHRGTGSVERMIGSIKNFVLTYASEKERKSLECMVDNSGNKVAYCATSQFSARTDYNLTGNDDVCLDV